MVILSSGYPIARGGVTAVIMWHWERRMKETAYLLQAALVSVWWVGLASNWFLIAALSTVRAYRKNAALEHVILGAFGYASLYCANATVLTASGYLPTGLMLVGFAYNAFLCFNDSLFRASTTSMARNVVKTLIQVVCIWILALVIIPYVILDAFDALSLPSPRASLFIGAMLFGCFSLLGLTSAVFMVRDGAGTPLPLDQTNNLVVSGPYRYVRNPMAIAGIGQGLAISIVFQSVPILIYSVLGALVWHLVVRPSEERDMAQRFGEPYEVYRREVSCWIPTFVKRSEWTRPRA
jgi:protein-S-isoprenylcysteine O-methyltransferase Ste14